MTKTRNRIDLAFGPMSSEVVEAVFRYSSNFKYPLMLIASRSQVDYGGGYVNKWTTLQYMRFIKKMRVKYPRADVRICRDHCGPGFNNNFTIQDVYKTIEADILAGFDLIHIDFCLFDAPKGKQLDAAKKAILYAQKLKPTILFEIGTDVNSNELLDIKNLKNNISFFKEFCTPEYYVIQTGSLVKEINQEGRFNPRYVKKVQSILKKNKLKLKEHNADYLSSAQLKHRRGLVDGMNIAPQLGVIQTQFVLAQCLTYGIDISNFLDEVYAGEKWKKWLLKNTPTNKMLCSIIAGHYHFTSESYLSLIKQLSKIIDIEAMIIDQILKVIDHYAKNTA